MSGPALSKPIPALTVRQPWAFAIANGHQSVESRKEATDYRGPVAIYAPAAADEENHSDVAELAGLPLSQVVEGSRDRQVIIAIGRLADVCSDWRTCACDEWAEGGFDHWLLEDVIKLQNPVSAMGSAGLWDMPKDVKERVLEQLSSDQLATILAGWEEMLDEPETSEEPSVVVDETPVVSPSPVVKKRSSLELREELLPLPTEEYRRVLLLGTTGAGKTTVIRQLLGTHPDTERFPSTSTAKTTVATSELILTDDPFYRAVITFVSRAEIEAALADNIAETAKACFEEKPGAILATRLLDHVSQRYRFSYLLGRPVLQVDEDDEWDDEDEQIVSEAPTGTDGLVREALDQISEVTRTVTFDLRAEYTSESELSLDDYIEDGLDDRIREHPMTGELVVRFMDEIEKRFTQLEEGELRRDESGWPVSWSWQCLSRKRFLEVITRFSSNQAAFFGTLLTPLVDGIRVSGGFKPAWASDGAVNLVLIDGEGLGHTPGSVATVSTGIRPRMEEADAILLVDNAQQPMQAAPVAVIKTIAATGNGSKLSFLFTHFDLVKGDNLVGAGAKAQHVRESAENVLNTIREELGTSERLLRSRLDGSTFFVGRIHDHLDPAALDPSKKNGLARYTMKQLNALLDALTYEPPPVEVGPSRPVYDREQLAEAVREATLSFHREWLGTLGLKQNPDVPKRHWATIKALTRRMAGGTEDEYRDLKPAASLLTKLEQQFHLMFQNPARWSGAEPNEEECQYIVDVASTILTKRLFALTQHLITDQIDAWRRASAESGSGSTVRRAHIIAAEIYNQSVPIPDGTHQSFLNAVQAEFDQVAEELELNLE